MTRPYKVFNIVGARPNMMKIAPIISEMRRHSDIRPVLIHTGQHYDFKMSKVFLEQLNMGEPDYNLQVGSGTHHWQTAEVLRTFGELVQKDRPDMIVVAGDVNSTIACALVGAKEAIPVAHVEAGLRSFDRTMPEEVNRILVDAISDLLFVTEESGRENLLREGVDTQKIVFTGNVMIDSLVSGLESARRSSILSHLGVEKNRYAILTLHRPANVDDKERFAATLAAVAEVGREIPVIFPVHPRTASRVGELKEGIAQAWDENSSVGASGIWMIPPASYTDFLCLLDSASLVITDSGGVQEETTYLGVPCLTYRDNTERPVTVKQGSNRLIGTCPENVIIEAKKILNQGPRNSIIPPPLWDGHAAERIVSKIRNYLAQNGEKQLTVPPSLMHIP
jgi:UDP-N-acetylglucosamine 2-epimerase (non-hydrolysing)